MNYWHRQRARNETYEKGVAVVVPSFEGWTFYVRPLTLWNTYYAAAAVRIAKSDPDVAAYLERVKANDYVSTEVDAAIDQRMNRAAFIEGCLVSWEGVTNDSDEPLDFGMHEAGGLFSFFPQLFRYLDTFARDVRNFPALTEEQKADIASGNSEPASLSSSERGGTHSEPLPATNTAGTRERRKK